MNAKDAEGRYIIGEDRWKFNLDGDIRVICPGCGKGQYFEGFTVDDKGCVTPSISCGFDCGFHENVVLEGWPDAKTT